MPNIDELWMKYTTNEFHTQTWYRGMTKEQFTQAIAEIISLPVEAQVSQENCGQRDEMLWNWKNFIDLNDNMSLKHIYQMLKDLDDRLQKKRI